MDLNLSFMFGSDFYVPTNIKDKRTITKIQNDIEFQNCFNFIVTNALDVFEWDLPGTCDARFLELAFLFRGQAVFYNKDGALLTLMANPSGEYNVYGNPLKCFGYGWNGTNEDITLYVPGADVSEDDVRKSVSGRVVSNSYSGVYARDNEMAYPYVNYIITDARRMADCLRSIDVTTKNLKRPALVTCEESYKNAVKSALSDIYGNEESIIAIKDFNSKFADFSTIDLHADPSILTALWECYDKIDSVSRQRLGIDCISNVNKKAQMLSGELSENNMALDYAIEKRLKCRKKACEDIRDAFGIDISVRVKHKVEQDNFIEEDAADVRNISEA